MKAGQSGSPSDKATSPDGSITPRGPVVDLEQELTKTPERRPGASSISTLGATPGTVCNATPVRQGLGERASGHQNQHTTAHALIKATIQSIWDREDLDIDGKISELQEFAKKFADINIAEDEKVKKLTADIEVLEGFAVDNEQLKKDIEKLIAFKKNLLFNEIEKEFIKQHHALPTSSIKVTSKRIGDTGISENNCMKELLEDIKGVDSDRIAKNLAGLFDANNQPTEEIENKVDFLSQAIENHLLFCEEFLKNKQITSKEIAKKIVDEIIKNHSGPFYSKGELIGIDIDVKTILTTSAGADLSPSSAGADLSPSSKDLSVSSPSSVYSSGSVSSSVVMATKGKIKIIGIHGAIANRISGKNTQRVIRYLTEIGVVNENNTVDIEKKINKINEEEILYRNSGLDREFIKQIKSIKVMELIAITVQIKPNSDSHQRDIANFGRTIPQPVQQVPLNEKNAGVLKLIAILKSNRDTSIEKLTNKESGTTQLYVDNIHRLLEALGVDIKKREPFKVDIKGRKNNTNSKKTYSKKTFYQLLLDVFPNENDVYDDLLGKAEGKINTPPKDASKAIREAAMSAEQEAGRIKYDNSLQEQNELDLRLTFNSSDELRKFIQETLLDPKLEFNIDNDPNSTSLHKFLDIIEYDNNRAHLDDDNKKYLANLLKNHLTHILIQYAQEAVDLTKPKADLDAFIKRLSSLGIVLNQEMVVTEAILLCTKPEIKHRLEKIKNPSASPTSSPAITTGRAVDPASLPAMPGF